MASLPILVWYVMLILMANWEMRTPTSTQNICILYTKKKRKVKHYSLKVE